MDMMSVENEIAELLTELKNVKEAFAAKYADYEKDKEDFEQAKKRITSEIQKKRTDVQDKIRELKEMEQKLKSLTPQFGTTGRSYSLNNDVIEEMTPRVISEVTSNPQYETSTNKNEFILSVVNSVMREVVPNKKGRSKKIVKDGIFKKVKESLQLAS